MANIIRRSSGQNLPAYPSLSDVDPLRLMTNLLSWDPFREMVPSTQNDLSNTFMPRFDVKENKDGYVFLADLPGVNEKDIDIQLTGNRLSISGKREAEEHNDNDRYFAFERTYGSFVRSFTLPDGADAEHVTANLNNGVLQVLLPKKAELQPRKVSLSAGQQASGQISANVSKGQKANA